MKNIFTLLLLVVALSGFGQTIDLVVFSETGDEFTLFVNSIKQNEDPRANVKAKDLKGESFVLRIEFKDESIPKMTKNIWTESKDVELTAVVKQNKKGKYVLRYMGETPKNPETDIYTEDNYVVYEDPETDSEPDYSNEVVEETVVTTTVTTEHVEGDNIEMSDQDMNVSMDVSAGEDGMSVSVSDGEEVVNFDLSVSENGMNVSTGTEEENVNIDFSVSGTGMDVDSGTDDENVNISFNVDANGMGTDTEVTETYSSTTVTTTTTTTSTNVVSPDEIHGEVIETQEVPANSRCAFAMSDSEFEDALALVKDETFEDDKFSFAKDICKANCMTSAQVRDMNNAFDFEDTKLDFAKFAYDYVYDIEKYYLVKTSFTFSMSKEELDEYLENK